MPPRQVQRDGMNPHGTGSYLVVYEQKLGDFILDFDYKLSKGCNSGVFLRVGDNSAVVRVYNAKVCQHGGRCRRAVRL